MRNRKQKDFNKVVNFDKDTNEITVLDYIFKHSDGFKGAKGSTFEPISKSRYDEVMRLCGGLDDSYSELWDYLREELDLNEDDAYMFNCTGGGRCFDSDFQGNVNVELSKLIREIETK